MIILPFPSSWGVVYPSLPLPVGSKKSVVRFSEWLGTFKNEDSAAEVHHFLKASNLHASNMHKDFEEKSKKVKVTEMIPEITETTPENNENDP